MKVVLNCFGADMPVGDNLSVDAHNSPVISSIFELILSISELR